MPVKLQVPSNFLAGVPRSSGDAIDGYLGERGPTANS